MGERVVEGRGKGLERGIWKCPRMSFFLDPPVDCSAKIKPAFHIRVSN